MLFTRVEKILQDEFVETDKIDLLHEPKRQAISAEIESEEDPVIDQLLASISLTCKSQEHAVSGYHDLEVKFSASKHDGKALVIVSFWLGARVNSVA